MINRWNVRWRNVFIACSSSLVTGRVWRLIRNAAYATRRTLCIMAVSYAVGLPALKSVIRVLYSHTHLVCFSVCTLVSAALSNEPLDAG
jgi:hypothetical protein